MNKFEKACDLELENWVNSIDEVDEITYSENHINKIKQIQKKASKQIFGKNTMRVLIVAAIVFSLGVISFAGYEFIESKKLSPTKGKIFGADILTVEGLDIDKAQNTPVTSFEYGYIPEGYVQEEIDEYDARCEKEGLSAARKFNKEDKHLELWKFREDVVISFANEKIVYRYTENGRKYIMTQFFYEGENINTAFDTASSVGTLMWDENGYVYEVSGLTFDEAIKVARNMK